MRTADALDVDVVGASVVVRVLLIARLTISACVSVDSVTSGSLPSVIRMSPVSASKSSGLSVHILSRGLSVNV